MGRWADGTYMGGRRSYYRRTKYYVGRPMTRAQYYRLRNAIAKRIAANSQLGYRRYLRGKGTYTYSNPGAVGKFGRYIGRAAGTYFGGSTGGRIGEALGGLLHYPARFFGSGDYGVTSANTGAITQDMPSFSNGKDCVEIVKREYICDIISSSTANTFRIDNFAINPGQQNTFPWLSQVCGCTFQSYRIEGCVFEFRSFSANALNSTNTALGTVVAAINYDSSDAPFSNRFEMENTNWAHSAPPSENFLVPVECKGKEQFSNGLLYIRHAGVPSGADIKTYDWGRLSIASLGVQGTSVNLGSLYVAYKIKLYKQIILRPLACAYYYHVRPTAGVDATHPLGTTQTIVFNNLNATATATRITLDRVYLRIGIRFYLTYVVVGIGATVAPTTISAAGLVGVGIFVGGGTAFTSLGNAGGGIVTYALEVSDVSTNPYIDFGTAGTYPTTVSSCDVFLMQVNPGV